MIAKSSSVSFTVCGADVNAHIQCTVQSIHQRAEPGTATASQPVNYNHSSVASVWLQEQVCDRVCD